MKGIVASIFRWVFLVKPLRRYYYGIYKKIFAPFKLFKGVTKTISYKGLTLKLDINDWIAQNIYFLGAYEEKELKFLMNTLRTGDVFIDIGANIGIFSLVASDAVGLSGKVYSFEPFYVNYQTLQNHIRLNNVTNVIAEKLALADSAGEVVLHVDEKDHNNGMATAYPTGSTYFESAETVSLDAYVLKAGITDIKAVKIDIEGGEYPALVGMRKMLEKCHPVIIIEINLEILRLTPFTLEEIESFLIRLSYKKMFLNEMGELISTQLKNDRSYNYVFV